MSHSYLIILIIYITIEFKDDPKPEELCYNCNQCCVQTRDYKSHDRSVICVSDLYGGCACDRAITADLGIMDKMLSGDTVMVDKDFQIHDLAQRKNV